MAGGPIGPYTYKQLRLKANLEDLLDELAIKLKWSVKGHAGIKPCFLCKNVLMKGHADVSKHPSFRDLSDLDPADFLPISDRELWDAQDYLVAQKPVLKKGELEKLEKACGQVCEPLGLMACQELRQYVQPTKTGYDSWHCYFVNGIAAVEVDLLTKALFKIGFSPRHMAGFCNDGWRPSQKLVFTDHGLKGMGSDVLRSIWPLWHMCLTVLQPRNLLLAECESFCALAESVQCLQDIKLLETVPQSLWDRLSKLQKLHADAHKAAYGTEHVKPKHHYTMHVPRQGQGMLVDTAPCERKERLIKAHIERMPRCDASQNCNIHITVSVNLYQLDEMKHAPTPGSLKGNADLFVDGKSARACVTSLGLTLTAGDVLLVDGAALLFRAGLELHDGSLNFLVQRCRFIRQQGAGKLWSLRDEYVILREPRVSQFCLVAVSSYSSVKPLWRLVDGWLVEGWLVVLLVLSPFSAPCEQT